MGQLTKHLYATDETFREVADLLFGGGADDLIRKMSPDQADMSTHAAKKDRKSRTITAGLSATGGAAGAGGLAYSAHKFNQGMKAARKIGKPGFRTALKSEKGAAALFPLEVAGLGGEIMATKILHGDVKKMPKKSKVSKEMAIPLSRRDLAVAAADSQTAKKVKVKGKGKLTALTGRSEQSVEKSAEYDITWQGEISKVDTDKRQVFGWASVTEMNGEPVVDLQGDSISIEEIEKSAYEYVQKSRKGGDMHARDGANPHHVSDMIESFLVTPEKISKMGLPENSLPTGWWVGYQVHDEDTWNLVKSGKRSGFSIHGRGSRSSA